MPGKTSDHLENLKKIQEDRRAKVDKFSKLDSKSDIKLSFDAIEDIIEQIIFNDQMDFLSSKNENTYELELASDKSTGKALEEVSDDKDIDKYLEQMELTQEQIDLLQKEFDQIVKELFALLAEIGGLLSELGSPPDPQKLALLKEKMQLLRMLRSRMLSFSLKVGHKYQKVFNFKYYFEQINTFVKDNESQLKQFGIDANLDQEGSIATKKLELVLERQKVFESLLEQVDRLEKELDSEKDPKKRANLAIQLGQLKEQILALEKEINDEIEASDINKEQEKENKESAEFELELEEAAAGMFAELNGLINGQRFGQYQLLAGESMNVHKTWSQILDDFAIGGQEIQNVREADCEKTNSVERVVEAGAEVDAAKDVTNLVEDVVSPSIDLDGPTPN